MLEDSGTKCFGKKYAGTSGSTAGSFFVDRVREEEKAYLETSPCIEMSTDSPLFAPRTTLIVLPSANTYTGVVATPL